MYTIKQVIVAKEHYEDLEATIFYNDIRSFGKGFERYYEKAKNLPGVRFIKSIASTIKELQQDCNLLIQYPYNNEEMVEEEFDLVVLSVGMTPSIGTEAIRKKLSIDVDRFGFCKTSTFAPLNTSKDGIFVAGAFQGPKDIPESIVTASGAASLCAQFLSDERGSLVGDVICDEERDVSEEKPRIGVFVCHCGVNIARVADVGRIREYAESLDDIVYAEESLYACSQDSQERIRKAIRDHNLNRVVVSACTPRSHESIFQDSIREAGLNRSLFEMVNIREHCTWVHAQEREAATEKAKDLVRMGVAKARLLSPLREELIQVVPRALVIGGGLSGMTAALALADQGFPSVLVERESQLGGHLKDIHETLAKDDPRELLKEIKRKVMNHPRIEVHIASQVEDVSGYIGNFETTIASGQASAKVSHGVVIVATGAQEYQPREYLHGQHERVMTQKRLEIELARGHLSFADLADVVMIQCVGSRTKERPTCSRICCSTAIKNALRIRELNSLSNIYILYRDMRTYGLADDFYEQARRRGILFVRYEDEHMPLVAEEAGELKLSVFDSTIGKHLLLTPSIVVLSAAVVPGDNEGLAKLLKVPLNTDGFFQEAHVKLRPVDFATDGVFVCGLAHSPKTIDESICQAQAAAGRAAIPLARGHVVAQPTVGSVHADKCFGCGICEYLCPYGSIRVVTIESGDKAQMVSASCKGCGICASKCPRHAITMGGFTKEQVIAQIDALGACRG